MSARINEITVEKLNDLIAKDKAVLVDVREEAEFVEGQIPNSIHMPLSEFEMHKHKLPTNHPIIFFCRSGRRSLVAADLALEWTSMPLYSLAGGIIAYKAHTNK